MVARLCVEEWNPIGEAGMYKVTRILDQDCRLVDEPRDDRADWPDVRRGDRIAFGRVFDRHADAVYRFALRRANDPDAAEDIVAEVFLQAWRQREAVHLLHDSLRPWLLGVAHNLVAHHWRRRTRYGRAVLRLPWPGPADGHDEQVVQALHDRERLEEIRSRIEELPAAQAEVLLLRAWEGLDYEDIATALDIPIGTVRSRLSRARAQLRKSPRWQRPPSTDSFATVDPATQPEERS